MPDSRGRCATQGRCTSKDNPLGDAFLSPSRPFVIDDEPRLLAPLYGYGITKEGRRKPSGEWSDVEHCPDATAVTAAALLALRRSGQYDKPPVPASAAYRVRPLALRHRRRRVHPGAPSRAGVLRQRDARAGPRRPGRDPDRVAPTCRGEGRGSRRRGRRCAGCAEDRLARRRRCARNTKALVVVQHVDLGAGVARRSQGRGARAKARDCAVRHWRKVCSCG